MSDNHWNKPLTDVRWKFRLPELVSAIKKQIDFCFKKGTGRLRGSFSLGNIHTIKEAGREGVRITNDLPYAQAQDTGAMIPERFPVRAKALHWINANGAEVYAKKARGFMLQGKNYIINALYEWMNDPKNIEVDWDES
jgi:hypothetical protein